MAGERSGSPVRLSKPLDLNAFLKDGSGIYDLDCDPLAQTDEFDKDTTEPEFRAKLFDHRKIQCSEIDEENYSGLTPFEKIKKNMFNVTPDGKIMKEIKKEGTGTVCPPNSHVKIHYQCHVENKDVPFDVSYLRSKLPESYKLGDGNLIPGLEYGIGTMKAGEKAWFIIHHDYAYGKLGCGQRIPKEAPVLFEVTLESFSENPDILMTNPGENLTLENVVERAEAHLQKGKERLNQDKDTDLAIKHFKEARNLIIDFHIDNDKDGVLAKLLDRVFTNLAICSNKQGDHQSAREGGLKKKGEHKLASEVAHQKRGCYKSTCELAESAMYINRPLAEKNAKLKFAWGKALCQLGDYDAARFRLKEAQKMQPGSKDIAQELNNLEKKMNEYDQEQKKMAQKMFKTGGTEKEKELPVSDSFVKLMTEQLEALKLSSTKKKLNLSPGMTGVERNVAKDIATKLGLKYTENVSAGIEAIVIQK